MNSWNEEALKGLEESLRRGDGPSPRERELERENAELKEVVGQLSIERALAVKAIDEWKRTSRSLSAREVAAMSLETTAGNATVGLFCALFGISRQAYYQAKAAAEGRRPGAKSGNELGEQPAELGPPALVESTSALGGASGEQGALRASAGAETPSTPGAQPMRGGREVTVAELERAIPVIVADHPAWGVRKVWATLRQPKHGLKVSKKRVWALMKARGLCLAGGGPRK